MKKNKTAFIIKISIAFIVLLLFILSANAIWTNLSKATKINPETVDLYRPYLNTGLVRNAAQAIIGESTH